MPDVFGAIRQTVLGRRGQQHGGVPHVGSIKRGWETIDKLYIWSAAVGLLAALVLIWIATLLDNGRMVR